MSFALVDAPRDRPDFLRETVDLLTGELDGHRARLLARVEATSDEALVEGSDDDWSVGMVAYHLLVSERGMMGIVMRLARGEVPTSTGQPRPVVGSATRQVIAEAAAKAASAVQRVRAEFPADAELGTTAPSPYFSQFNCISWLFASAFHYRAHLHALEQGVKSAL